MARSSRSVNPDLAAIAEPMEKLMEALERLTVPTGKSSLKAPYFNGKRETELFIKRLEELVAENR